MPRDWVALRAINNKSKQTMIEQRRPACDISDKDFLILYEEYESVNLCFHTGSTAHFN